MSEEFLHDVQRGLMHPQQKQLSARFLYDDIGSLLFEAITHLPEYGLTRADERILHRHARLLPAYFSRAPLVVELGSGSGRKTRSVIEAFRAAGRPVPRYAPIDVSRAALELCREALAPIVPVEPVHAGYLEGLARVDRGDAPLLVLFLGSTIGNFAPAEAAAFLRKVGALLRPGDALLVGADLRKEPARTLQAYDDPTGVTAAFNLNLLGRINRELGGEFELRDFEHQARYDELHGRVEMHLVARRPVRARVAKGALEVCLHAGESIWTESSHKFQLREVEALFEQAGLRCAAHWVDEEWPFTESLAIRKEAPEERRSAT